MQARKAQNTKPYGVTKQTGLGVTCARQDPVSVLAEFYSGPPFLPCTIHYYGVLDLDFTGLLLLRL